MASANPGRPVVIGNWYQDVVENLYFEVVAHDSAEGSIEIQYLDGEVSEIDQDSWNEMILNSAPPPEDASAAFEMSMPDNNWDNDLAAHYNPCSDPLNSIEPDLFQGSEEF
ncbi:MAG: hypothetical protein CL693_19185 [Cellvibrionaceae bacterium]|nr:hypothetical protein [Cellvibrionaceae bacterium]|tara:strand:+ start:79169 stop:79501 length:333 start_codon:yes stop_codon:yes gene_type:complete